MKRDTVVAKKQFGQNFLKDQSVLQTIIEAMPERDRMVAEIGPGLGDLTKYLVDIRSVVAFEVDPDLCKHLNKVFDPAIVSGRLTLHCGDVLKRWDGELLDVSYDLVANLPYYIATNIILKALADPKCEFLLVMVQREVAEKFSASPSEKVFGALSVIAQSVAEVRILVNVPPEAFDPPPKVESAVLLMKKAAHRHSGAFEQMLKAAFAQPRKTLLKNLSARYGKDEVLSVLSTCGYASTIRPHQVTTADYHRLFAYLE